jgi:hypothetical protein
MMVPLFDLRRTRKLEPRKICEVFFLRSVIERWITGKDEWYGSILS